MFESMNFLQAKLKTVDFSKLAAANSAFSRTGSGIPSFSAMEQYKYNSVGFVQINGGVPFSFTTDNTSLLSNFKMGAFGRYRYRVPNYISPINIEDYAIYISYAKVGDNYSSQIQGELITATTGKTAMATGSIEAADGRTTAYYAVGKGKSVGLFNDWYYITSLKFYNRGVNSTANRQWVPNVFPCIPVVATNYKSLNDVRNNIVTVQGNFEIPILLDIARAENVGTPIGSANLFDFVGGRSLTQPIGDTQTFVAIGSYKSAMFSGVKYIGIGVASPQSLGQKINWNFTDVATGTLHLSEWCTTSRVIFQTPNDILSLLADWGIERVTFTEKEAISGTDFPEPPLPPDEFVPDGGNASGYDDNPIIPDLPSYPDNTSDLIEDVTPNLSPLQACGAYALNNVNLKAFFQWLMTDTFVKNISELFNDKLSALNDVKLFPFDLLQHDSAHLTARTDLTIANVTADEINCYEIDSGYNCWFDGGSISLLAYHGNYNDYINCQYSIYIPYVGIVDLSPSYVVNCNLAIRYAVDLLTGNASVQIRSNNVIVKIVNANIAQTIPIISTNVNQQRITDALRAISIGGDIVGIAGDFATGNVVGGAFGTGNLASTLASNAMTNPYKIQHSGTVTNSTGLILSQTPFLIISRAKIAPYSSVLPIGRPVSFYGQISSFNGKGLVKCRTSIISTNATEDEKQQILNLLNSGIII